MKRRKSTAHCPRCRHFCGQAKWCSRCGKFVGMWVFIPIENLRSDDHNVQTKV